MRRSTFFTASLVNPARAGMILHILKHDKPRTSKPRASGDDPVKAQKSSPCER